MEVIPVGMNLPNELEFRKSDQDPSKIGVWTKKQVNRGRLYGPFKGEKKRCNDVYNDTYSWQIIGPRGRRLFCIDATDASKGNWMRFVKTAPNNQLHNLCPVQHKKKIYYKVLKTITSSTELLCWYEGAADLDNNTKDSDVLPMPVLEKMDVKEDLPFKSYQKIPSPLQVHPDSVPDTLEPPLISPMYPMPPLGLPPPESSEPDKVLSVGPPEETASDVQTQVVTPAIQAPDVTSTGEVNEDLKHMLPLSTGGKDDSDMVTSSQINTADGLMKDAPQKKSETGKLVTNKDRKKLVSKYKKHLVKESAQKKGSLKVRKDKEFHEMIMEPYIIGPDSVVVQNDGSEKYMCHRCGKLCKYPVGLKIHLRTNHHLYNVYIKGIAKKPWARGITKERERNPHNQGLPVKLQDKTWKSVDCSVVQSALEKLKDSGQEKKDDIMSIGTEFYNEDKEAFDIKQNVSSDSLFPDGAATDNMNCQDAGECAQPVTGSGSEIVLPQPQPEFKGQQGIPLNGLERGSEVERKTDSGCATQAASSPKKSQDNANQAIKKSSVHIFPKKYSCHICHQAFAYKFWRDRHLQKHLKGESSHICQVCNLRFFSKKNLISHEKTHIEEKGNICQENIGNKRENENEESFTSLAITLSGAEGIDRTGMVHQNRLSWPQKEHSGISDYKSKGNRSLENLVTSLQRQKSKFKSSSHSTTKGKQAEKSSRGGGERKYFCRLCGSAFSNPSNRSRHMKAQHGVAARKKVVETRLKEKNTDFVLVEGKVCGMSDTSSASRVADKSVTKPATRPNKKMPEKVVGKRNPWTKMKVNKVVAHQRSRSKRKSTFMTEFLDYEEFPRGPGIICPWDRVNMPDPYVPQKKPCAVDMTCIKSESFHHFGVSDSLSSWNVLSSHVDGHLMGNCSMLGKTKKAHLADQPLDLSCRTRMVTVGENLFGSFDAFHDVKPVYGQDMYTLPKKGRPLRKVLKHENKRSNFKGNKISSKISQKQNAASLNPVRWHFVCNICDGSFMSIRELSQHVIAHAEDYPYKCEFCMNVFTSSNALRDHKQTKHSVKKMYTCSVCKQEFAYLSNLKKHQNAEHSGMECTFDENFSNDVRPQNFTDPTKAFNLRVCPALTSERVSFLKEEMDKLTPLKTRVVSPSKKPSSLSPGSPKKQALEKSMLFNPQRNHPFEKRRKIGFLSMLSDPRNQKQLGSKVNNVCTKCLQEFKDTSEFHVHIMECANIKDDSAAEVKEGCEISTVSNNVEKQGRTRVFAQTPKGKKSDLSPGKKMLGSRRQVVERAKPGSIMYDPQKYIRVKSASSLEDIHACAGCGKKFYFINKLERHMKLCPNRDKIVSAHKSNVALALRKRPRLNTVQHKCTNCDKHFTYLGSLEKHLLLCTSRDLVANHSGERQPSGDTNEKGCGDGSTHLKQSLPTHEQESFTGKTNNFGNSPALGTGKRKRRTKSFESFWQLGKK